MKNFLIAIAVLFTACTVRPDTSDGQQQQAQERLNKESNRQVGMPSIVNFQEKRMLKNILELRDTEIKTITYLFDMQGHLHKLCDSVGFGFPYATQFTNPQRADYITNHGSFTLPQADPNGLFSPAGADGTWVMCLNPETQALSPLYVEPHIIVSPFHLKEG